MKGGILTILMIFLLSCTLVSASERFEITDPVEDVLIFEVSEGDEIKFVDMFKGDHVVGVDNIRMGSKAGVDFKVFSFINDIRKPVFYVSCDVDTKVIHLDLDRNGENELVLDVISLDIGDNDTKKAFVSISPLINDEEVDTTNGEGGTTDGEGLDDITGQGVVDYEKVSDFNWRDYSNYVIGVLIILIVLLGIYKFSNKGKVVYYP